MLRVREKEILSEVDIVMAINRDEEIDGDRKIDR